MNAAAEEPIRDGRGAVNGDEPQLCQQATFDGLKIAYTACNYCRRPRSAHFPYLAELFACKSVPVVYYNKRLQYGTLLRRAEPCIPFLEAYTLASISVHLHACFLGRYSSFDTPREDARPALQGVHLAFQKINFIPPSTLPWPNHLRRRGRTGQAAQAADLA